VAQIVIDANVGIALAINLPYSDLAERRFTLWREAQDEILVPGLWKYEVVSALRKAVAANLISESELMTALEELFRLGVREMEASIETNRLALSWASRLKQMVAYDSQYLALAEQIGAEFWTADKRLAEGARKAGAHWVRWLGEK
jgi:predicted nucleic acid-binding protein